MTSNLGGVFSKHPYAHLGIVPHIYVENTWCKSIAENLPDRSDFLRRDQGESKNSVFAQTSTSNLTSDGNGFRTHTWCELVINTIPNGLRFFGTFSIRPVSSPYLTLIRVTIFKTALKTSTLSPLHVRVCDETSGLLLKSLRPFSPSESDSLDTERYRITVLPVNIDRSDIKKVYS